MKMITSIKMAGREEVIEIGSGIRQGCTASMELFKLVTFIIMRKLEEEGEKFILDDISMNSLFFADDSIMLARTVEAAKRNLKIIVEASKEFGLNINEEKSKILLYKRGTKKPEDKIKEIEGIEVVEKVKYLGIQICNNKDIFKKHKEEVIAKAREMANKTYWTIGTSCNRVLM